MVCALYCMCFLIVHYCFVNLSACFEFLNHRFLIHQRTKIRFYRGYILIARDRHLGFWVSTGGSKPNRYLSLYSVMLILGLTECGMF